MYKKILIKSEQDLPKEGKYFIHRKYGNEMDVLVYPAGITNWLEDIDWYLIESPISVPTETEIEKHFECHVNSRCYMDGAKWAIDEIIKRNK